MTKLFASPLKLASALGAALVAPALLAPLLLVPSLLAPSLLALPPIGACPGGAPLASFDVIVRKPGDADPAMLRSVTKLEGGATLRFVPRELFGEPGSDAQVALISIPTTPSGVLGVLEAMPASAEAEWIIPSRAAAVALVYGPQGLSLQKVAELMRRDPHLISQLAEYAEKSAQTELLMETVTAWERNSSGQSLEAALQGLSSRSGVAFPTLNRSAPMDQQALSLMRTLHPALSGYDPLAPTSTQRVQQTAGLAATMAGLFFGNTVGVASVGGAMFLNVRSLLFPGSEFRTALAQQAGDSLVLCSKREAAKSRTRPVFLWAWRIQGPPPPKFEGLPFRVNLGEANPVLPIKGTSLETILGITSDTGTAKYAAETSQLRLQLPHTAKKGDRIALRVEVEDSPAPMNLPGAIEVLGPRPKLGEAKLSRPRELSLRLAETELPANAQTSVSFRGEYGNSQPTLHLECKDEPKRLSIKPGDRAAAARLSAVGKNNLFLTFDASAAGLPPCPLVAKLETEDGFSDPVSLGQLVRLPRLDKFELTAETLGPHTYSGWVEGEELELIEKSGWDPQGGLPVTELPSPVAGGNGKQRLKIAMPWPPPAPKSALYVWLRGENAGRRSTATY